MKQPPCWGHFSICHRGCSAAELIHSGHGCCCLLSAVWQPPVVRRNRRILISQHVGRFFASLFLLGGLMCWKKPRSLPRTHPDGVAPLLQLGLSVTYHLGRAHRGSPGPTLIDLTVSEYALPSLIGEKLVMPKSPHGPCAKEDHARIVPRRPPSVAGEIDQVGVMEACLRMATAGACRYRPSSGSCWGRGCFPGMGGDCP